MSLPFTDQHKRSAQESLPIVYNAKRHKIDKSKVDPDAAWVLHQLRQAGHQAYLVGGGVRDLLLGKVPKDFDISTSARPEEIKKLFGKKCLLIGRRFRLAHIRFGRKVIEVSTFRTGEQGREELIVRDNEWGTPEEDALRRDFTINGLFYDSDEEIVIDYVGGWADLQRHTLATIGRPEARFKQDPVRMIRLMKFCARFNFSVDERTQQALHQCFGEIVKSSPARLLEELMRMLESGSSAPFFRLLSDVGMLELLMPTLHRFLLGDGGKEVFDLLKAADDLNSSLPHPLSRSVLSASLFYPILEAELRFRYLSSGEAPSLGEIVIIASEVIEAVIATSFIPFTRRNIAELTSILAIQWRMTPMAGKTRHRPKLMKTKDFALAMDFFKMRAMVDPSLKGAYKSWQISYRQQLRQADRIGHQRHPPPFRQQKS